MPRTDLRLITLLDGMKTQRRIVIFGVISGFLWTLVCVTLIGLAMGGRSGWWFGSWFESPSESLALLATGVLTGVVVSFLLYAPLRRWGPKCALIAGAFSLPAGAFLFGMISSLLSGMINPLPDGNNAFYSICAGIVFAVASVMSSFVLVLLPLAMVTSWLLFRFAVKERPTTASSG